MITIAEFTHVLCSVVVVFLLTNDDKYKKYSVRICYRSFRIGSDLNHSVMHCKLVSYYKVAHHGIETLLLTSSYYKFLQIEIL